MPNISLREYNREIERLIDNQKFDEAIAHCRYILQTFPKHIDTYRLLGRAYLEAQQFNEADDIFQRVLSSIPDDFVSHLGMSVVREEHQDLNIAIWHMERAYDVQPSNTSVQRELRRLYGLRDEVEPAKIHLTQGALARMYLKGDLYPQAISELRAALAEDPHRTDLQALLARAFFLAGQKVEAVETCGALVTKLPYCLEANHVLQEVLPETERADEAETYRERVIALDPYAAHLSPHANSSDDVPDSAIMLKKHEWISEEPEIIEQKQSDWVESLGIDFEGLMPSDDSIPDWLEEKPGESEEEESEFEQAPKSHETEDTSSEAIMSDELDEEHSTEKEAQEDDLIPDWMKSSGWEPAAKSEEISSPPLESLTEDSSLAEETADADMPDWLHDLSLVKLESDELEEESVPWLEEPPPDDSDTVSTWLNDTKSTSETDHLIDLSLSEEADLPDWLDGMEVEEETTPSTTEEGDQEEVDLGNKETAPLGVIPLPSDSEQDQPEIEVESQSSLEESEIEGEFKVPEWLRSEDTSSTRESGFDFETDRDIVDRVDASVDEPEQMEESSQPELDSQTSETVYDQVSSSATEFDGQEEGKEDIEPVEETTEEADELEEEPLVLEMPASFEKHASEETTTYPDEPTEASEEQPFISAEAEDEAEYDKIADSPLDEVEDGDETPTNADIYRDEGEVESPPEKVPGVTDWLRTLEETKEDISTGELVQPHQDHIGPDKEKPADRIPGVTGWLQTLETLGDDSGKEDEEVKKLREDALFEEEGEPPVETEIEELEEQIETGDQDTDDTSTAQTLVSGDEEFVSMDGEVLEKIPDEQPTGDDQSISEESAEGDEIQIAEPDKRIPGVTDWLRTLKEIDKEGEHESQDQLDTADMDRVSHSGEGEFTTGLVADRAEPDLPDINEEELEDAEIEEGEVPDWLQNLEFELSGEHETDDIPGVIPDWLHEAAQGEEEDKEFDWTILPDEEEISESIEGVEQEQIEELDQQDQLDEQPILGDTQPIRRRDEEIEEIDPSFESEEEEIIEEIDESEPEQADTAQLTSAEEEEAAMAWLDGLATRQGLQEDKPVGKDKTTEEPPDWIQEAAAEAEAEIESQPEISESFEWLEEEVRTDDEEPAISEVSEFSVEQAEEPEPAVAEVEAEELPSPEDDEETLALEETEEPEPIIAEVEAEELPSPEDEDETLILEEAEEPEPIVAEVEAEELPSPEDEDETLILEEAEEPEPIVAEVEAEELPSPEVEGETPVLEEAEEPEPAFAEVEAEELPSPEDEDETLILEEAEEPEPAFAEVEAEELLSPEDDEETLAPEEAEEPEPIVAEVEAEELPSPETADELLVSEETEELEPEPSLIESVDVNTASLAQLERIPGVGFIIAQSILSHRETQGRFNNLEDLLSISEIDEATLEEIQPWVQIATEPEELPQEQIAKEPELVDAWRALQSGEISVAVEQYLPLIKEHKLLDSIIRDIKEAIRLYPTEISLFEVLGDACVRNNQLQDALDAYTQAEDLL